MPKTDLGIRILARTIHITLNLLLVLYATAICMARGIEPGLLWFAMMAAGSLLLALAMGHFERRLVSRMRFQRRLEAIAADAA